MKDVIRYNSTNGRSSPVSFREAMLKGLAPDGGLYLPDRIPVLSGADLKGLSGREYYQVAAEILYRYISGEMDMRTLEGICRDAYNFEVPFENVFERKFILRLDRGPTASFKDFAARIMSRLMQFFLSSSGKQLTVLTATSGDTGGAVASAFYGLENISAIILFPKDEVTTMQRKQMTTLGRNIHAIAIDGKFDDCQALVKKAFRDESLEQAYLTSANSINIGRLLPQSVYYIYSWLKLASDIDDRVVFSVPSGNFGNLTAGILALKMGLPVEKFIVSTNENDEVPEFLKTGIYEPVVPSKNCISSAMNVGHPSNLSRLIALFGGNMDEKGVMIKEPDMAKMTRLLSGTSVNDDITRKCIAGTYNEYGILIEPHGATAWYGVCDYLEKHTGETKNKLFISLETAHPAKFPEEIEKILHITPGIPASLSAIVEKKEEYISMNNNYNSLKEFILESS